MTSFFENRMKLLGVTNKNNRIDVIDPMADVGSQFRRDVPIFSEDKNGNIEILFTNLKRELIHYEKKGSGKMSQINAKWVIFKQIRWKHPKGSRKYHIPSTPYPFIPPLLQKVVEKKKKVKRIFLTEGAFKAWKAALYNIYVFGLTSITHYRDKETKKLHRDIIKFIIDCEVEEVVVLWDADCLDISQSQLFDMEDITRRPKGFFHAARNIRALLNEVNEYRKAQKVIAEQNSEEEPRTKPLSIYFWHIKKRIVKLGTPKGLDDLIIECEEKKRIKDLIQDIESDIHAKSPFFQKMNITHEIENLKDYYLLNDPEKFYYRHADIIQKEHFMFENNIYEWTDNEGGQLKLLAPGWTKKVVWVGTDFYVKQNVPSAYGEIEERMVRTTVDDLKRRTGQAKFWEYLKEQCYDGFINIPNHYNYQQTMEVNQEKYFNKYFQFKHRPEEGSFETTIKFIKHIFGFEEKSRKGKRYVSWELGLDYVQLLLERPTQTLPVLILYSEENATGKSTFGNWLRFIFGSNAIKVSNKDFKSDFNEHFSAKLLVICEETLLDRRKDSEAIKDMATSKHITVNTKGTQQYQIEFFAKFIFMSNNKRMIYLTKHDQRYWILKVPRIKEDDPEIMEKLKAEFPAFLHWIKQRKLKSPYESRMHFHYTLIRTHQFMETVLVNEPKEARELRNLLEAYFNDFGVAELRMPLKEINEYFFKGNKSISWIKEILRDYNLATQSVNEAGKTYTERGVYYQWSKSMDLTIKDQDEVFEPKMQHVRWVGRGPWIFKKSDFIAEIDDENNPTEGTQLAVL